MLNLLRCLVVSLLLSISLSAHADPGAQTVWRLLDYIAVDYPVAVADGKVISEAEYAEMVEFAASVRERTAVLPPSDAQPQLLQKAQELQAAIDAKRSPETVAALARGLAGQLLLAYPMPLAHRAREFDHLRVFPLADDLSVRHRGRVIDGDVVEQAPHRLRAGVGMGGQ